MLYAVHLFPAGHWPSLLQFISATAEQVGLGSAGAPQPGSSHRQPASASQASVLARTAQLMLGGPCVPPAPASPAIVPSDRSSKQLAKEPLVSSRTSPVIRAAALRLR
jgi:hypothetical protein